MRLFGLGGGGNQQEDPEAAKRQEASLRSLEQGGLPLNATDRLREQAGRQGTPEHIFTSDLSVNELSLAHEAGYEPLGQVMGSSIYHIGWQWTPQWSGTGGELTVLTQAYYDARHRAIGRLKEEAMLLGATGVVGVRLERRSYDWGSAMLEFIAIGTAIRETGTPHPGAAADPWVSDLGGQDFWLLRQAGFQPVGFALGNCSYYQVPSWNTQYAMGSGVLGGGWNNQELPDFTQAVYTSRELAMTRMEAEALRDGATGVVGADVEMEVQPHEVEVNNSRRTDLILHFTATGTAIAPYTGRWPIFTVRNTIPLR